MKYITRTVWTLSLISLFTDVSSEMLYPVMPLFLASIGFTSVMIGLLEGLAEATAGLSKGYFGRWSDNIGRRAPFVQLGYSLSALSKPMMALFTYPLWIFTARTADRLGKGIRGGARDAILSAETTPENKGKVFGFHQGMDTLGAAIGPVFALIFLAFYPGKYKWMFLLAFIPGLLAVLLTFLIKEKTATQTKKNSYSLAQTFNYLKIASPTYIKLIVAFLLFAIFNSSDLFLLMKVKAAGLKDEYVIGCYILYNIVYAIASFPLGDLGDRIGLKSTYSIGLFIFVLVYAGFGFNTSLVGFIVLYIFYGIYAATNEGISKALISNIVPKGETASAIGTFAGLSSITALLASTIAGLVWKYISPDAVFLVSAAGALLALIYILLLRVKTPEISN